MSQSHDKSEKITLNGKLSLLIQKYSYIFLGSIIAIVFIVIGLLIYNSIQTKNIEIYTQEIESIQTDFENSSTVTDDGKKDATKTEIKTKLKKIIDEEKKKHEQQQAI